MNGYIPTEIDMRDMAGLGMGCNTPQSAHAAVLLIATMNTDLLVCIRKV